MKQHAEAVMMASLVVCSMIWGLHVCKACGFPLHLQCVSRSSSSAFTCSMTCLLLCCCCLRLCRCHARRSTNRHTRSGQPLLLRSEQRSSRQTWSSSAVSCSSWTTHPSAVLQGLLGSRRSASSRSRRSRGLLHCRAPAAARVQTAQGMAGMQTAATPLLSPRRCEPTGTRTWMRLGHGCCLQAAGNPPAGRQHSPAVGAAAGAAAAVAAVAAAVWQVQVQGATTPSLSRGMYGCSGRLRTTCIQSQQSLY